MIFWSVEKINKYYIGLSSEFYNSFLNSWKKLIKCYGTTTIIEYQFSTKSKTEKYWA
jgi:hypothetical protein